MDRELLIKPLLASLEAAANPATKAWFEKYLRYAITYRGVKTPVVRRVMIAWYKESQIGTLEEKEQLQIAALLLGQPVAEDKFAGTLMIQKYLLKQMPYQEILAASEQLYAQGAFYDWSTTDWYCVRVLGRMLKKGEGAARISGWKKAFNLWQRRSAIVPFSAVVDDPNYDAVIAQTIATLVREKERFIQTGVGWVIGAMAKKRPDVAEKLVEKHFEFLSAEVIRRHTKPLDRHKEYKRAKRSIG